MGEEIKTDYINDDKIGRVMDELYKHGLNDIFIEVVLSVIKKFKIEQLLEICHLSTVRR